MPLPAAGAEPEVLQFLHTITHWWLAELAQTPSRRRQQLLRPYIDEIHRLGDGVNSCTQNLSRVCPVVFALLREALQTCLAN